MRVFLKVFLVFVIFGSFVTEKIAIADPFVASYFEARKVFMGRKQMITGAPWMSAYSDLAVYFPMYSSGKEFGLEGQYNFWGPFSVGGKFLSQWPDWSSKNNYYLGPTAQLKFGNSFDNGNGLFDVTFRAVPLFDLNDGFGRFELYLIPVAEYKKFQLIPAVYYFWTKDFTWFSTSHQVTISPEVAYKLYYKRLMVLVKPEYTNVKSYDKNGNKAGDVDVFTFLFGLKGEVPVRPVTFWWQISAGPQKRSDSDTGGAVFLSGGGRF